MNREKPADYGVVVVSFSSGPVLESFLTSLRGSQDTPSHVVVVENGPEKPQRFSEAPWRTTVVHLPHNPGYGSAVNEGVRALPQSIRWVLVSNPDVALESTAISELLAVAISTNNIGSVGPALVNDDGTVYPSARAIPGIAVGIGHALFGAVWRSNPWTAAYRGSYGSASPREAGWLSGACLLLNRSAFDGVGGFDTRYFMFMEDVDLGMRLGQAGAKNIYVPASQVHHTVGHATRAVKPLMTAAHHRSARLFLHKRYPGLGWLPLRVILGAGLAVRQALVVAAASLRPTQNHPN